MTPEIGFVLFVWLICYVMFLAIWHFWVGFAYQDTFENIFMALFLTIPSGLLALFVVQALAIWMTM